MSEQFNIGDDVIVVNDFNTWLDTHNLGHNTVLKVVEKHSVDDYYVDAENELIEIRALIDFPEDFQVVSKPKTSFVTLLNAQRPIGAIFDMPETIIPMTRIESEETVSAEDVGQFVEDRVKEIIQPQLGVYRPQLETRKVGKVRVELVDKGFPNTLWALAELLTWAQETKGYKDHDWVNIPNALDALPAAASRHRVKHNKGMLYDEESGKLHKLHELFGVMAECELLLKNESDETLASRIKQMCSTESK